MYEETRREARGETRDLYRSIKRWAVRQGVSPTHTDLAGGSFHVPTEDYREFMEIYQAWVSEGNPAHLTERPLEHSRARFDLDIKKRLPVSQDITHDDVVPPHIFRKITEEILHVLAEVLELPDGRCAAYVMRKPEPTAVQGSRGIVSAGIHIVVPDAIVSPTQLHYARQRLLPRLAPYVDAMQLTNSLEDVVDHLVFQMTQGWMMYGSSKLGQPPYEVVEIVEMRCADDGRVLSLETEELNPSDIPRLPSLLSMRDPALEDSPTPTRASVADEVAEYARILLPEISLSKADRVSLYSADAGAGESPGVIPPTFGPAELALARELVRCLKEAPEERRAERNTYRNWILLGMALKGAADVPETRELFLDYSSLSSKFVRDKVEGTWRQLRPKFVGLKQLHKYAQEDNPEGYREVLKSYETGMIDQCIAGALAARGRPQDYLVASMIASLHGNKFVSTGRTGGWWYYNEHTGLWAGNGGAMNPPLRQTILASESSKISAYNAFNRRAQELRDVCHSKTVQAGSEAERKAIEREYGEKIEVCGKYAGAVRNNGFQAAVESHLRNMVYDEKIVEKLDANRSLMHFEGGKVYDFSTFTLRDARPEDYLTLTTGNPFLPWQEVLRDHAETVREIEQEFFGRIQTDPEMCTYLLDVLAASLDGGLRGGPFEKLWILYGPGGANGKSKMVELLSAAFNNQSNGYVNDCLPVTLLTEKRGSADAASPAKEGLRGVRFAFSNEPDQNEAQLNCGTVKELTGGDTIHSRKLYSDPVNLNPQCKFFLLTNFLPHVGVTDGGTWRRFVVVEFKSKFFADASERGYEPDNPLHQIGDPSIMQKFPTWKTVFAAMLIERHRILMQEKGGVISVPRAVEKITARYREDSDRVAKFISQWIERIEDPAEAEVAGPLLLEVAFRKYAQIHSLKKTTIEKTDFERGMVADLKDPTFSGKGGGWLGYRLREE